MQGSNDVKYESPKQRQQWLAGAMKRMDERLAPEKIREIREASACCLGGERARLAQEIRDSHATVAERFKAFAATKYIVGDTAAQVDENTYRVCFREHPDPKRGCSCMRYVPKDEPMPKSWCLCCGGHIKTPF